MGVVGCRLNVGRHGEGWRAIKLHKYSGWCVPNNLPNNYWENVYGIASSFSFPRHKDRDSPESVCIPGHFPINTPNRMQPITFRDLSPLFFWSWVALD